MCMKRWAFGSCASTLTHGRISWAGFSPRSIMSCCLLIPRLAVQAANAPQEKLPARKLALYAALTAIALLFAMISINPSPLCLFDEIDAPLDEGNARLFAEYLRKIENTQFLIVTHRKSTMAMCDSLYGVAMEEKGVSKLVSVKLK